MSDVATSADSTTEAPAKKARKPAKKKPAAKKKAAPRKAKASSAKKSSGAKGKAGKTSFVIWVDAKQGRFIKAKAKRAGLSQADYFRRALKLPVAK